MEEKERCRQEKAPQVWQPHFQIVIDIEDFRDWTLTINGKKIQRAKKFSICLDQGREPITYDLTEYAVSNTDWIKKVNGEYAEQLLRRLDAAHKRDREIDMSFVAKSQDK